MANADMPLMRRLAAKPSAELRLVETQPPLIPGGPTVWRYTTARGVVYEQVESPAGVFTWYQVLKP